MGFFVQITGDTGSPVFQAAKNYPEVSFASSALFHALVTASLEQGFVPSVLRAQDVTIALSTHGVPGCRLSIAVVTSEFAAGQTRDLEAQLQWRLDAIYHGALLAAGAEQLRRQSVDLRRLLLERLSPIVTHLMAEETVPGTCGRVPCMGMAIAGGAVEWLLGCAADAEFQRLVGSLPAGGGAVLAGLSPAATSRALAVLSWQGRVVAATTGWCSQDPVYRALLLGMVDSVGPASFESPSRSWALEELEHLWLPMPVGEGEAAEAELRQFRMSSVRLYPGEETLRQILSSSDGSNGSNGFTGHDTNGNGTASRRSLGRQPDADERARIWSDELSFVFSVLQLEDADPPGATRLTAADLQQSADFCGDSLQELWAGLRTADRGQSLGVLGGEAAIAGLVVAMLLDEQKQEVVVAPSAWHSSSTLPWHCSVRQRKVDALRRLAYWLHALPPLGPSRDQHYVHCEGYALAAVRREDGLQCWGVTQADLQQPKEFDDGSGQQSENHSAVLGVVIDILRRVPPSTDVRKAFAGG